MKKDLQIETVILHFALMASIFLITYSSMNLATANEGVAYTQEVKNDYSGTKNLEEKDLQFLITAVEINLEEIKLGQLAGENAENPDVKKLAKRMEDSHTKVLYAAIALAKQKRATIPTEPTNKANAEYKKLAIKQGADFDKNYCDMMVNVHKDAISLFEKATKDCVDTDVKAFAENMLSDLKLHLDHSLACQKKYERI